jgi:hypothetical protein
LITREKLTDNLPGGDVEPLAIVQALCDDYI